MVVDDVVEVGDVYEVGVCVYLGSSLLEIRPSSLCLYMTVKLHTLSMCTDTTIRQCMARGEEAA